jgi:Flp pilus assembly protein TadG
MARVKLFRKAAFPGSEAGTSAVEFALLSPLYFLLLMGMAAYGLYFGVSHSLQQIAADAARAAVAGLSPQERERIASGYVLRNAGSYPLIDEEHLSVETGDNPQDPTQFIISLDYDALSLPIWNLFDGLPLPPVTITRRSTIRIGGL